jgi:uncharacterized repeat protein (TIGR01451 family)
MLRFRFSASVCTVYFLTASALFGQNDKQVLGNSRMTPEQILAGEEIVYLIRFQNTGPDTVRQIAIRDTLDPRLDPASFFVIDASHPYQLLGEGGSEIRWYFEDIFLPDSTSGGSNSIGYILFSVRPRKFLAPGQSIVNSACMVFDDTVKICTNEAIVTIDYKSGLEEWTEDETAEYYVIPNPNYGQFEVRSSTAYTPANPSQCWVTDFGGRKIWMGTVGDGPASGNRVWLEKPSPGHYLLWIKSEKRLQVEHFTIIR